jgi:hypothetical protein
MFFDCVDYTKLFSFNSTIKFNHKNPIIKKNQRLDSFAALIKRETKRN